MYVVVGLGNPGSEYDGTRHNVGFGVIDALADRLAARFRTFRLHRSASGRRYGAEIVLVKPQTYMNNSGEAVRPLLSELELGTDRLLVVCDDLHLPLGTLRLRKKGSDGGHNGLSSLIRELGTDAFARLRCGISGPTAPAPGEATADYVLSDFDRAEIDIVDGMTARAAESVLTIVRTGIDGAMNIINTQ
ncbi:MAG TPA: aminoacyl-tRNA hydrolase [Bacteroidota bacterium]|nr:aminoacyl-tRNA hydrolase [Bacteroidota bacterium]